MFACFSCGAETENVAWVPKFNPLGAYPFCAKAKCQQVAHRRAKMVFANKPSPAVPHVRPVS